MARDVGGTPDREAPFRGGHGDPAARAFLVITASASTAVFTVTFQIGAFGVVFFDRLHMIWVLSTATLLGSLVLREGWTPTAWGRVVLAVPSLWLLIAFIDGGQPHVALLRPLTAAASVITVLSLPYLAYALVRAISPSYLDLPARRLQLGTIAIALVIGVAGLLLGRLNDHYLTCGDFVISGNDQPANCRPGDPAGILLNRQ